MKRSGRSFRSRAIECVALFLLIPASLYARENSSLLYNDGAVRASKGDIDGAILLFERAVQLSPWSALAHYGLGRAYLYKEGRLKDSIRELKRAVDCDRKLAKGYFYLGFAYMFSGKYEPAIESFSRAYKVDRTYIESLYNIGALFDIMGNESKANLYFAEYYRKTNPETGEPF